MGRGGAKKTEMGQEQTLKPNNEPDMAHTTLMRPSPNVPVLSSIDRALASLLNDPRDTMHVYMLLFLTATLYSTNIWFFVLRDKTAPWAWYEYAVAVAHVAFCIRMLAPFVAILHCICHVPLFKNNGPLAWLNTVWIQYVLCPVAGQSPNTYYCHHIKMHHVTGNNPDDLSCTTFYHRDSIVDCIRYFGRFFFLIIVELPLFFAKRQQWSLLVQALGGEVSFFAALYGLSFLDGKATFALVFLPWLFTRFGMMSGNWGQHAFVDPERPHDDYVNSLTVVNCHYNWVALNDGYHTSHHLNSMRHWTEHPVHFQKNLDLLAKKGTIVFDGLDFHGVFFALMFKNYNLLADRFVRLPGDTRSKEEIIDFLKSRVKPIPNSKYPKWSGATKA